MLKTSYANVVQGFGSSNNVNVTSGEDEINSGMDTHRGVKPGSENISMYNTVIVDNNAQSTLNRSFMLWLQMYKAAKCVLVNLSLELQIDCAQYDHPVVLTVGLGELGGASRTTSNFRMTESEGHDRISCLPDDMLHRIMSFMDVDDVIRTSVLSTRWKSVWTSLPFLNFEFVQRVPKDVIARMVNHFFATRNHLCQVLRLKLNVDDVFTIRSLEQIVRYAVDHGVEDLNVRSVKFSIYTSSSLRKLTLAIDFDKPYFEFLNRWNLPILHTLHLEHYFPLQRYRRIPVESLTCLPSLISLTVVRVCLPESLDLPLLQTLILLDSDLPERIWNLPCLNTLEVTDIHFPSNFGNFLATLVHLENLRLISSIPILKDCVISSPRLINLELKTTVMAAAFLTPHILVLSPNISNISIRGIILVTCGVLELETVTIDLQDCILDKVYVPAEILKQFYCRLSHMLSGLGGAKILKIDFDTFEALSVVSNYLEHLHSPFYKLNYVRLPQGCKESSISATLKRYLLGSTAGASIVTTIPRNPENHLAVSVSQTSQKVMSDEPSATPMKKLIFHDALKKVCSDTVENKVKVENMVENSVVDAGSVRQAGASVSGTGIDQASSSRGNTDIWEWQGHEAPVSPFQKVIQDDPFAALTKELVDFHDIHKEVCADSVEKMVKVENVRQAGAAVAGTGINQARRENTDIWDWQGQKGVPVSTTNQKVMLEEPLATPTKQLAQSQGINTKVRGGTPVAGTCNVPVFKGHNQLL